MPASLTYARPRSSTGRYPLPTAKFPGYYLANGDDAPWMAHCDNGPAA